MNRLSFFFPMLLFLLFLCMAMACTEKNGFEAAVRMAVNKQMQTYPASTLKDLYKSFFQDKFGPGHLIGDTAAAGDYLRRELASYSETKGEAAEPTGWEGNFYRVNLSVVKNRQVPYGLFLDAFIRSANEVQPPSVAAWKREWKRIEAVIRSMNLPLPGYEADRSEIDSRLDQGNYIGHHSESYEALYSPHYRIVQKEIFEKELLPLISF
ncbi:MAG: hypothetical protein LBQ78_01260 [Tannerellaceae bacterium]|jgi:hypothetical protein|nr:hypothetical protein [Tannerellaceae bacterium]